jgi:hypothetical protein
MPSQLRQLTANSIQSPYFYRANGLLQIAVSALLRTRGIGTRNVARAEHCRYGTRDLALIGDRRTAKQRRLEVNPV